MVNVLFGDQLGELKIGKAIKKLYMLAGNYEIEFYHGVVTVREIKNNSVYVDMGEGDDPLEALEHAGLVDKLPEGKPDNDTITDDYQAWSATCPMCGEKSMSVVRPGKVQCGNCG